LETLNEVVYLLTIIYANSTGFLISVKYNIKAAFSLRSCLSHYTTHSLCCIRRYSLGMIILNWHSLIQQIY